MIALYVHWTHSVMVTTACMAVYLCLTCTYSEHVGGGTCLTHISIDNCVYSHHSQASHNKVTSLAALSKCPALQHLDVSHNLLSTLKGIDKVKSLVTLNVQGNTLMDLTLPSLPSLTELVAAENRLASIGHLAKSSPLLDVVDVSGASSCVCVCVCVCV